MSLNLSSGFSGFNLEMDKGVGQISYEFENFCLDASQRMLSRDGEEIALPPKVIETLLVLVERRGKIVSKEELLESVWKDVIVEESNLYGYLHVLRSTLGDQENGRPFIETLRRRGYRFNGAVRVIKQDGDPDDAQAAHISTGSTVDQVDPKLPTQRRRRVVLASVCAMGVVILTTAGFLYFKPATRIDEPSHNSVERYPRNTDVHKLSMQGIELAQKLTPEKYKEALEKLDQAKALDPTSPWPYVGLATANRVNMLSADASPANRMPSAKAAGLTAVTIAPDLSDAHVALGMITFFYEWDWEEAEAQLVHGYNLEPDSENTNIQLAHFYSNMGRHDKAVALSDRAVKMKPESPRSGALHGMILFYAGKYDQAIESLREWIQFKPDVWLSHLNLQRAYIEKGMYAEALKEGELAEKLGSKSLELIAQKAYIYAKTGKTTQSRQALTELQKIEQDRYIGPYLFAIIYNGLGETREALKFLEAAHQTRDWRMTFLKVDPRFNNLRSEPRFIELMRKMHFE